MTGTLADLVGPSVMLSFPGPSLTPELADAMARVRPCGVVLFAQNVASPAALHELCAALQAHAAAEGLPPLLIGIDQEGGIVSRLPAPFAVPPSQMAQAATGDARSAFVCAEVTGRQLRACGVNINFAPPLDINCNPANPVIGTRSFGADAATVTEFGLAALEGYRAAGVVATAKHFPGHGDTHVDSHLGLPTLSHDRERLDAVELAPFRAAIRAGVPAIMSAHIVFEALDTLPATLSRPILTDLLRGELGFEGLIFTDALTMRAIGETYGPRESAIRARAAGADVLLPLGSLSDQIGAAEALAEALAQGRLSAEDFAATARRLDQLRSRYGIDGTIPPYAEPDAAFHTALLRIARRGTTVSDAGGLLPLDPTARLAAIDCQLPRFSNAEEAAQRSELLRSLLLEAFPQASYMALPRDWDAAAEAEARALAQAAEAVLLVTRNAAFLPQQAELAQTLASGAAPLIHAAVRNPDAALAPDAATIQTYGDPPLSMRALVDALRGQERVDKEQPL